MIEAPNADFVPITDATGKVTGMMDRATADFLSSQAPDPTQTSLDELLSTVTRVRVVPFANFVHGNEPQTLLDTCDPASLVTFRECFRIVEDVESFGHCMCFGDPHIELYAGDRLAAVIGHHHGASIRWDAWKFDAILADPDKLLDWMTAHGADGPRRAVEETKLRDEESRREDARWFEAMPESLRPFWEQMRYSPGGEADEFYDRLLSALLSQFPDRDRRVSVLFGWYGSGTGLLSGYPYYEEFAEWLLSLHTKPELFDVLARSSPTPTQWRGAIRHFCAWITRGPRRKKERLKDPRVLPDDLKARLIEAAREAGLTQAVEVFARNVSDPTLGGGRRSRE